MANAFGLGDMASMGVPGANPAQGAGLLETLELVRKAWGSFALPPGLTPTLDPTEIERRIAELRSIEQWLAMNLTMLRGTIQAFEIQQSTLSTLRSIGESSAAAVTAAAAAAQTGFPPGPPDEAGIADLDEARAEPAAGSTADASPEAGSTEAGDEGEASEPGATPFAAFAGGTDPLAWWDMLQKQFGLVANAAMASIPVPGPVPGMPAAPSPGTTATPGQAQPAGQSADAGTGADARARSNSGRKSGAGAGSDDTRAESSASGSRSTGSRAGGSGTSRSSASGSRATKSSAGPAASRSSERSTASGGRRRSTRSG